MVPPGIKGYEPAIADYAAMSQLDREDEAKKILTELGYGPDKPLKMEIRFNTSENHKNTAVAITIGLLELTGEARSMQEFSFQVLEAFTAATLMYLAINIVVVTAMRLLERRVALPGTIAGK